MRGKKIFAVVCDKGYFVSVSLSRYRFRGEVETTSDPKFAYRFSDELLADGICGVLSGLGYADCSVVPFPQLSKEA